MWRTLSLVVGVVGLAGTLGCDKPEVGAGEPSATAKGPASSAPRASASVAPAPTPAPGAVPVGGTFAALPRDAFVYARADAGLADVVLGALPAKERDEALAMLTELLGENVTDAKTLTAAVGIDGTRPLLVGALAPPAADLEKLVDEYVAAPKDEDRAAVQKKVVALDTPPTIYLRLAVPVAPGQSDKLLAAVAKLLRGEAARCDAGDACKGLEPKPHTLFTGDFGFIAAFVGSDAVTLEVLTARPGDVDRERGAAALSRFHANVGGPDNTATGRERCTEGGAPKGATVCLVPARVAEAGVSSGLMMTLGALSGGSLDHKSAIAIATMGRTESLRSRELHGAKPQLFDDGTFSVSAATPPRVQASWLLLGDTNERLAEPFGAERCATDGAAIAALLDKLRAALGVAPKAPESMLEPLQEAGWAAYPVLAGGAFPPYLPFVIEALAASPDMASGKTCVQVKEGRLVVETSVDLEKSFLR